MLDIILSLAVALLSGSVIMLTQALEGFSDLAASGLLLIGYLKTLYIGSERLLVMLDVNMKDQLTTRELEHLIDKIQEKVKKEVPSVKYIQVELETRRY